MTEAADGKGEKVNPEIERLRAENRALKERVAELEEMTDTYAALVDGYDQELTATTDILAKANDALENFMKPKISIERIS